jgi:phage tail tape-measure protein
MNRTWLVVGLGIALAVVLALVALPSRLGTGRRPAAEPPPRHAVGVRAMDLRHLPKPAYQQLMESPPRPIGASAGIHAALRDARLDVTDEVRAIATEMGLDLDDVARLDALRAEADAGLDAVQASVRAGDLDEAAAKAAIDRIRTKLVQGVTGVVGATYAEAIAVRLGPAPAP